MGNVNNLDKKYFARDIKEYLVNGEEIIGSNSDSMWFTNVAASKYVNHESLDWVNPSNSQKQYLFEISKAKIIIVDDSIAIDKAQLANRCIIVSNDPKFTFATIVNNIKMQKYFGKIHKMSSISPDASIHESVYIGPNTNIGKVKIGKNSVIHGNCTIYDNVQIGNNVTINAGTVIGSEGFGYVKNEQNENIKFPHLAGVLIGNDVEIGSNTSIDRGSLSDTIIEDGVKIDNLVHIAHNVKIRRDSVVIANSMIGGSTIIGFNTWIAPSVSILEQLQIGNNVVVGVGAVVTKNIPDGETWAGSPAKPIKEFVRIQKIIKSL